LDTNKNAVVFIFHGRPGVRLCTCEAARLGRACGASAIQHRRKQSPTRPLKTCGQAGGLTMPLLCSLFARV
jgi:hypothetical protein